jgi:cardiolipin synthase
MLHFFKNIPAHEKKITISTMLTLGRIALVPSIVGAMVYAWWGIACALFGIAAITDALDGYLARLWKEQTMLGACLDPLADKLLVLACFFTLAYIQSPLFAIPQWFVVIVLIKELLLIIGTVLLYGAKGHIDIRPTFLGKITTMLQLSFIAWLFACYFFGWVPVKTYSTLLVVVLVLVCACLVQYGVRAIRENKG